MLSMADRALEDAEGNIIFGTAAAAATAAVAAAAALCSSTAASRAARTAAVSFWSSVGARPSTTMGDKNRYRPISTLPPTPGRSRYGFRLGARLNPPVSAA